MDFLITLCHIVFFLFLLLDTGQLLKSHGLVVTLKIINNYTITLSYIFIIKILRKDDLPLLSQHDKSDVEVSYFPISPF